MLFKLALENIRERKLRNFLASLSITIGTACLLIFLGLGQGIKNVTFEELEKGSPLNQITVRPNIEKTGIIGFLHTSDVNKLNEESLEKVQKIPGIKNIHPEIQYNNFASMEASVFGVSFVTDTMIFGLTKDFLGSDLKNPQIWDKTTQPYPVLVPRKMLDLYNLAIANPQNLPKLSEESLMGKKILLFPNHSSFFPIESGEKVEIELEVVGFSDKINLIGLTLPYSIVEDLNTKYATKKSQNYLELFVEVTDPSQTSSVAKEIEALGYQTHYLQQNFKDVEAKFAYLNFSLGILSLIILLTATIAISSTFLASVTEKTREIGLLRALGATKSHIKKIILFEAGIIGFIGSVVGIVVGVVASLIINEVVAKKLTAITLNLEKIIQINFNLTLFALAFGIILSLFSAYLPALKASNINPIEALNRL